MKEWLLVLKAADAAARWHVHQRRKGPAGEPYINHLLEVAMLVAEATGGKDTNLVVTALLHDAIEDCEVPKELIAETFGADVAALVQEVTDDKNLPKAVRKDEQIKTAPKKSSRAKVLKLADKTSNLRAVAASPPANWSVKRRKEYVDWAREVVQGLRGVNQELEDQFDEAAAAAPRRSSGAPLAEAFMKPEQDGEPREALGKCPELMRFQRSHSSMSAIQSVVPIRPSCYAIFGIEGRPELGPRQRR
jgi:GTP diphosphokinase / guanosine-3',5'-bis(diphosphate) 3'-diphosphatase